MICKYVDAEGCPQRISCFSQFAGQLGHWTPVFPEPGGTCTTTGQVCDYVEQIGDNLPMVAHLECDASGQWQFKNPCPPTLPAEGAPCANSNTTCPYAEFGAACAFLCSAQAGYITGQNLLIDGGTFPGAF